MVQHIEIPARELRPGDVMQVVRGSSNYILVGKVDVGSKVAITNDAGNGHLADGPWTRLALDAVVRLSLRDQPLSLSTEADR